MRKEKIKHKKIAWVCDNCHYLTISDTREHHNMNMCKCGKAGVDLEYYMARWAGNPRVIAEILDGGKWKTVRKRKPK